MKPKEGASEIEFFFISSLHPLCMCWFNVIATLGIGQRKEEEQGVLRMSPQGAVRALQNESAGMREKERRRLYTLAIR